DVNGYKQEGFALFDRNVRNGRRYSAARAYLHPAMKRPSLEVKTRVLISRILFGKNRAVGVEYLKGKQSFKAMGKEIILCAGAFGSPQILQLSGVGNARELEPLGIPV